MTNVSSVCKATFVWHNLFVYAAVHSAGSMQNTRQRTPPERRHSNVALRAALGFLPRAPHCPESQDGSSRLDGPIWQKRYFATTFDDHVRSRAACTNRLSAIVLEAATAHDIHALESFRCPQSATAICVNLHFTYALTYEVLTYEVRYYCSYPAHPPVKWLPACVKAGQPRGPDSPLSCELTRKGPDTGPGV